MCPPPLKWGPVGFSKLDPSSPTLAAPLFARITKWSKKD